MDLTGRTAIITGANRGLGRAIAEQFVRAGASVFLTARDEKLLHQVQDELRPLASKPGQKVHSMRVDVADPANCRGSVEQAVTALGEITALVNNAGVYGPMGPIESVDWDAWVQAIQVNLFGTV
ncbi:MAG: SDR family NAD(P)-dependent oxidoreductase, partial [Tepidisphaeraceae bacterium]